MSSRSSSRLGWLAAAALLLAGIGVGLVLMSRPRSLPSSEDERVGSAPSPAETTRAGHAERPGAGVTSSGSPWQTPPDDQASLPPGYVPASQVALPPPPTGEAPPVPEKLPDPEVEPPKDNPGGVNGTRPPRPIPGAR